MKIKVMGSAAAEAVPAIWCECDYCRQAWENMGKDVRMRTSYLVDDDTLIDFGPDIFQQSLRFRIEWNKIRRVLVTHAHADHLNPVDFQWRHPGFSVVSHPVHFYGGADVMERMDYIVDPYHKKLGLERITVEPFREYRDDDLSFYALPANHSTKNPLNYLLRRNGKSILIANDTGWWAEANWNYIKNFQLDAAIIECTMGIVPGGIDCREGHLGANVSLEFRDKLLELDCIGKDTPVYVNHFSHNGNALHDRLESFFAPYRIGVCYDGAEIRL